MLLINVDDAITLINGICKPDASIRHEGVDSNDELTFFDTDKFIQGLESLPKTSFLTPDIVISIFSESLTKGHIDYTRD